MYNFPEKRWIKLLMSDLSNMKSGATWVLLADMFKYRGAFISTVF